MIGMLLKFLSHIRRMFVSVPEIPDGRINIKGPAGIIIKGVSVPIPAIPRIIVENRLGMIHHNLMVDGIAFHIQKRHVQHVEQSPVLRHCVGSGIAVQKSGDRVLFLLGVGIPYLFLRYPKADHQRAGLHRLLETAERIVCTGYAYLILIRSHIDFISPSAHPKNLILIIIPHRISVQFQIRFDGNQRRADEEGTGQTLENLRFFLGLLHAFGRLQMGVGNLRLLSRHHHRILKGRNISKHASQQIFPSLDPAFPGQARIGA